MNVKCRHALSVIERIRIRFDNAPNKSGHCRPVLIDQADVEALESLAGEFRTPSPAACSRCRHWPWPCPQNAVASGAGVQLATGTLCPHNLAWNVCYLCVAKRPGSGFHMSDDNDSQGYTEGPPEDDRAPSRTPTDHD